MSDTLEQRVNSLRAGVLGSSDGILTTVGIIFSLGIASSNKYVILVAGISNLVACAISMSAGEYNSVTSQKQLEQEITTKEYDRMRKDPESSCKELTQQYMQKGISQETAERAVKALRDPVTEILENKYNIEKGHSVSPVQATIYSLIFAFCSGIIPLVFLLLMPSYYVFYAGLIGAITSVTVVALVSSKISEVHFKKTLLRNMGLMLLSILVNGLFGLLL
jgi:VIT1/CCC1 family predicted Fe2+/Mn2+ transporter